MTIFGRQPIVPLLSHLGYHDRPAPTNIVCIYNPRSGGARGEAFKKKFFADINDQPEWRCWNLDSDHPDMVVRTFRPNVFLKDFLQHRPQQSALFLETVKNPDEQVRRASQVLRTIHDITGQMPLLQMIGGDGTIVLGNHAGLKAAGLSLSTLFSEERINLGDPRFTAVPIISAAMAGTTCDIPKVLGATRDDKIVTYYQNSTVVPLASAVARIETPMGTRYLDVSHSLDAGIGGTLFEIAEKNKYGFWKGTKLPYLLAGAKLALEQAVTLGQRLKPYWVHYRIDDQEEQHQQVADFLMTGMRYLGGTLYSPATPIDGLAFFLLSPHLAAQLITVAESYVRGKTKKTFGDEGYSQIFGDVLRTLPPERQFFLRPGQRIKARFTSDEQGLDPAEITYQAGGEPLGRIPGVSAIVLPPYPTVAHKYSYAANWALRQAQLGSMN